MIRSKSLWVLLTVATASSGAMAVELDASASVDIYDKYVWRGIETGKKGVIQPSATVGKNGFSFNLWGNMPINKDDYSGKPWAFNELNYTLDYSGSYEQFNYAAGYIIYDFPRNLDSTLQEIYGSVGMDILLSPTLSVYKGTYRATGFYVNLGVGHSIELTENLALDLGSSLGWADNQYNKFYFSGAPAGFNDFVVSAALPIDIAGIPLTPSLSYVTMVDDKVRGGNSPKKNDNWIIGIGSSIEF